MAPEDEEFENQQAEATVAARLRRVHEMDISPGLLRDMNAVIARNEAALPPARVSLTDWDGRTIDD